ncbi:MAG: porin family protein [Acidobacteriota bacterium]|nr:porin family protein [Acidobacteriota bacterium]
MFKRSIVILLATLAIASAANAQKNDLGFGVGGYFAASNPLNLGAAWAIEGSYARQFAAVPLLSVSAELPIAASYKSSIPTLNGTTLARSYTSLFITPGVRVRLAPSFFISPYVAAGLGYGRFNRELYNGTTSPYGAFAFDVAGGLDVKILPFVSLRGEVRDFNSSTFGFQSFIAPGRQNNVFVTLGLGVRF